MPVRKTGLDANVMGARLQRRDERAPRVRIAAKIGEKARVMRVCGGDGVGEVSEVVRVRLSR